MFTKRYDFCIRNDKVLIFTRLLGEYGLRFKIGKKSKDEIGYRRVAVYGGPFKMARLFNAVHICMLAELNIYV